MSSNPSEVKKCDNCDKDVPASSHHLHELHCKKHLVKCNKCGEAVPKNSLEEHEEEEHKVVQCELCQTPMEEKELADHKKVECKQRPLACSYCRLEYPYCQYADHEDACGSRTDECEKCGGTVMLRDMLKHESSKCSAFTTDRQSNHKFSPAPHPAPHPALLLRAFASPYREFNQGFVSPNQPSVAPSRSLLPKINNFDTNQARNGQRSVPDNKPSDRPAAVNATNPKIGNSPNRPTAPSNASSQSTDSVEQSVTRSRARPANKTRSAEKLALTNPTLLPTNRRPANQQSAFQANSHFVEPTITKAKLYSPVKTKPLASSYDSPAEPQTSNVLETIADQDCIPCEFCRRQLPVDLFLRHQSDCAEGYSINDYGGTDMSTQPPEERFTTYNNNSPVNDAYANSSTDQYVPRNVERRVGQNNEQNIASQDINNPTTPVYPNGDGENLWKPSQHYRHPDVKPLSYDSDELLPESGYMRPLSKPQRDLRENVPEFSAPREAQPHGDEVTAPPSSLLVFFPGRGVYALKYGHGDHQSDKEEEYASCEYCDFPFLLEDLMRHQLVCKKAPRTAMETHSSPARFFHSGEHTHLDEFSPLSSNRFQSMSLVDREDGLYGRNYPPRPTYGSEPFDDESQIPCDHCKKEFDADTLTQHEFVCPKNMGYTSYMGGESLEPAYPAHPSVSDSPPTSRADDPERQRGLENYSTNLKRNDSQ